MPVNKGVNPTLATKSFDIKFLPIQVFKRLV
jgi:hypothetical protein